MSTRAPARTHARRVLTSAAGAVAAGWVLAAPAAAHVPAAVPVTGMTSGRLGSTSVAVLALVGVVVGALSLARQRGAAPGSPAGRRGGTAAVVLGLAGTVGGAALAATADGGLGSGSGVAGAVVAAVLGLVATALGTLALTRSRRSASV